MTTDEIVGRKVREQIGGMVIDIIRLTEERAALAGEVEHLKALIPEVIKRDDAKARARKR